MKILIVSDAAPPQINGVVRTLENVGKVLEGQGHKVFFITPQYFKTIPLPTYKEIQIAWDVWNVKKHIKEFNPDAIHIATEGPIGLAARNHCVKNNIPFTTSFHTKFPEYIHKRIPVIPERIVYKALRWFHQPSKATLVTTQSMKDELETRGFQNLVVWTRGVDFDLFTPQKRVTATESNECNILLYVGRVSIEKNLEAFLSLNPPNTHTVVVGDGPDLLKLKRKYPHVIFRGAEVGEDLALSYANADIFVFPSKTDTFGIVMLEAMASGLPVAAFPVTGPKDVIVNGVNGWMDNDLEVAINKALQVDSTLCVNYTKDHYSWEKSADIFKETLVEIR